MDHTDPGFPEKQKSGIARTFIVYAGFFIFFLIIIGRMFYIQVIQGGKYQEAARQQYEERLILKANRGIIYDRRGIPLVTNQIQYSYGIDPYMTRAEEAPVLARKFSKIFGKSYSGYLEKIRTRKNFVWLERGVTPEQKKQLSLESYHSIVELKEPTRLYRYNEKAGQVLGFTNIDNKGISGIELSYDSWIRGRDGYTIMQRDGRGQLIPAADYARQDPQNGKNVSTTLDIVIQSIVDEELAKGVKETGGSAGIAVFVIPQTGEIVAMSNFPGLDPNHPEKADVENTRIRAITDVLEPGSTFKLVTAAGAFEYGLRNSRDKINGERGTWLYKGEKVIDHEPLGTVTFEEGVVQSSNVVMAKTGLLIGEENFYKLARNFGFGMETGIDIAGEIPGTLKQPNTWSGITLAWMAFGYEVLVTPIQMMNAYAAVANRGQLMKPFVVKSVFDETGKVAFENKPTLIRQVVTTATIDTLIPILVKVVTKGTAKAARIENLQIAGKTGTAKKVISGKYEKTYMASFVGFFPAERPQLAGIVIIDSPEKGFYGGAVSAPVFGRIAQRLMSNSILERPAEAGLSADSLFSRVVLPDMRSWSTAAARAWLEDFGIEPDFVNEESGFIVQTEPAAGTRLVPDLEVKLVTAAQVKTTGGLSLADLKGKSLRQAVNILQSQGFQVKIQGSGQVVKAELSKTNSKTVILTGRQDDRK